MTNVRILIVEDKSIVAMHIQSRLRSMGYRVAGTTSSGDEAVQRAAETLPDLVLMAMAGPAAVAIENARSYQASLRRPRSHGFRAPN